MLNEQYRMEPEIAEIANRYYDDYKKLESRTGPEFRQEDINKFSSWFPVAHPKHNVQLIDTESLHAWVTGIPQGKGHSRLNCFSGDSSEFSKYASNFFSMHLNAKLPQLPLRSKEGFPIRSSIKFYYAQRTIPYGT